MVHTPFPRLCARNAPPVAARGLPTLALALALGGSALLAGCSEAAAPAAPAEAAAPTVQSTQLRFPPGHPQLALLEVTTAQPSQDIAVDLPARLVWNEERTQRIYPAFAGRVTAIRADLGQTVKAGSALATLASPDFGQAQADTAKAHAEQNLAHQGLRRQRELFEAGIVARKDLEQAEADAARAQAEVARAAARTSLYGSSAAVNQQLALSAGMGGVVVERNVNPGQEVRPDQSGPGTPALFVVTDPSTLWVQIDARESDLASLRAGDRFVLEVSAYPGETFAGRVTAASDSIDPATRTIKVRGLVANTDRRLKAEMLATARIKQSRTGGAVIPAQAVTLRGTVHTVFVESASGVFEPRAVTLAHEGPREVVVGKGLAAGDKVVTQNVLLLARQFQMAQEDAAMKKGVQ
ncbi:efflux RND transporter periplasmic adaptor subunit [Acidovorax sp. SRB_24]|uniref:efflux RND transporter periplasmic adaptor subunit n=1 Tax=Acidovorax sp. SRB_24 TaxID=1962700 RepID=UPI00145F97B2|nr:efflux RND transporter periplasmic adaptor subunit [Acidovorax sp. SRB_24]NMM76980.1 efflux transporter periplasmic adaptor subunit [Acidovorax sp. SRB_24]